MFSIQIIQELPELQALEADWHALSTAGPQSLDFFSTWNFTWHYVSTMQPRKWLVVCLREAHTGALCGVFPWEFFTLQADAGAFRAVQPLAAAVVPYVEPPLALAVRRDVLQVVLDTVLRDQLRIDLVCWWPLHEASPLYQLLTEDLGGSAVLQTFRYSRNIHELETRGLDYEQYCLTQPGDTFADARYQQRRLGRLGEVALNMHEDGAEALRVADWMCQGIALQFGADFLYRGRPRWPQLVRALVGELGASAVAEVATLRLDGRVIAASLSYWHKGRRYYTLCHYDPAYARFSPGKILMRGLIEQTFHDKGIFCFGAGNHAYKGRWARSAGELKAAYVFLSASVREHLGDQLNSGFIDRLWRV